MKNFFKKYLSYLLFLILLVLPVVLVSCGTEEKQKLDTVSYKDAIVTYTGSEQSLEITGELPKGYTVSYDNNAGTNVGDYFATADIKNKSGKVVQTLRATLSIDYPDSDEFEAFLDQFLVDYLAGDQFAVNLLLEDPKKVGLDRYDGIWYTYGTTTEDDPDAVTIEEVYEKLKAFDKTKLSQRQELAYDQIHDFLEYQIASGAIENIEYINNYYVDQFGGYVANFGSSMESYTIREEEDIKTIVSYIRSTETAFASYVTYLEDKANAGYPLSNFTLYEMTKYLNNVLSSKEDYYLIEALWDKIEKVDFISVEQKTDYKAQIKDAICNEFMNGVQSLRDGLNAQRDKLADDKKGYWAAYSNGKEVFELELKNLLGIKDLDVDAYISMVDERLKNYSRKASSALNVLIKKYKITTQEALNNLLSECIIFDGTPTEMIDFLKEFAKTIVPDLKSSPNITVKEMDTASASVSNALAYYTKSAIDATTNEYITLNPLKLDDKVETLSTMAHEGYPGHLYAYCYSKELDIHNVSKIMQSTAHAEGWASYVQIKLYEYAKEKAETQKEKDVLNYLYFNELSSALLETRLDAGIHLEKWSLSDISKLMRELGYNSSHSIAEEIYNLLIETPTSYATYGYGKLFFYDLHEEAKEILKDNYNEIEFNAMLLSKGWTSLDVLKETYNDYMMKAKHRYGIEK